jgi:hypothetical protein
MDSSYRMMRTPLYSTLAQGTLLIVAVEPSLSTNTWSLVVGRQTSTVTLSMRPSPSSSVDLVVVAMAAWQTLKEQLRAGPIDTLPKLTVLKPEAGLELPLLDELEDEPPPPWSSSPSAC